MLLIFTSWHSALCGVRMLCVGMSFACMSCEKCEFHVQNFAALCGEFYLKNGKVSRCFFISTNILGNFMVVSLP